MLKRLYPLSILFLISMLTITSCDDNDGPASIRTKIEYSSANAETPYSQLFVDNQGQTTVDLIEGNTRLKMFQALNYYSTSSISANTKIDAAKLKSLFSNSGNPFSDISTSTITVVGANLNNSGFQ